MVTTIDKPLTQCSASEIELKAFLNTTENSTFALLPYWALHCAAQFASTDNSKLVLNCIHIRTGEGLRYITIESTNGHKAFRLRLGLETPWFTSEGKESILIDAAAFKKRLNYASYVTLKDDGKADIYGGKVSKAKDGKPPVDYMSTIVFQDRLKCCGTYPNLDNIWPTSFNGTLPAVDYEVDSYKIKPIAFNAKYLKEIAAIAEKYGQGYNLPIKLYHSEPSKPAVFTMNCTDHPYMPDNAIMEFLIMPVALR